MNIETTVMVRAAAQEYENADMTPSEVTATSVKEYFEDGSQMDPPWAELLLAWTIVRTPVLKERVDWELVAKEARFVLPVERDPPPTLTARVLNYLKRPGVNLAMRGIVEEIKNKDTKPKQIKETVNTLVRLGLVESHSEGTAMWFSVRPV